MYDVFITDVQTVVMPCSETKEPRKRYKDYFNDLYKLYGSTLDDETFYQGGQFTFAELGEQVLDKVIHKEWFKDLDILLPTYWSFEFDPDYSSCGPYFQEKYGLLGQLFDICEQGTLAGFTGLHILQKYLCAGDEYKKGVFLALEQTTIPRKINDFDIIPEKNGAVAILLQQNSFQNLIKKTPALRLYDVQHNFDSSLDSISKTIEQLPTKDEIVFVLKKNTRIWKLLKYNTSMLLNTKIQFITYENSMLTSLEYLGEIIKQCSFNEGFYVLLEEDVESLNSGLLIVEKVLI